MPTVATFCELPEVLAWMHADPGARFNVLVFGEGKRNVCGNYRVIDVSGDGVRPPVRGTQYHLAVDSETLEAKAHGENAGMVNDWSQDNAALLVAIPELKKLFDAQHREGWKLGLDRHWRRDSPLSLDTSDDKLCDSAGNKRKAESHGEPISKKLRETLHRDYKPGGEAESRSTWKAPPGTPAPPLLCVETRPGRLSLAVLKQSEYHGIPRGGKSWGPFLSSMGLAEHANYKNAFCARVKKELARLPKTDKIYVWPEFSKLDENDFDAMVLATIVYGLPPPIFPSALPMNIPQPYAGAIFPHFRGMRPDTNRQCLDPASELAKARASLSPRAFSALERVAQTLPGRWVASPAAVAPAIEVLI